MEETIHQTPSRPKKDWITFRFRKIHLLLTLPVLTFIGGIAAGYLFWGQGYSVSVVNAQDLAVEAVSQNQAPAQAVQQPGARRHHHQQQGDRHQHEPAMTLRGRHQ